MVGLGQVGCGYDANLPFHWDQPNSSPRTLTHARALACHPCFELLAGVDPNPVARDRFARVYRKPAHESIAAWRAASTGPDPDLVVIAVAPQLQPALVEQLLALMAPRLLLLEKPVAASLDGAHSLERACSRQPGIIVGVNYVRRFLPAVIHWKQLLQAGELGKLLHGQITYGKGLLSNGSHFVNLAEAWLGPLTPGLTIDPGPNCFGFDREASLELCAAAHFDAPLVVRSVGGARLRAGELDLWFQGGRLCWRNDGRAITFWKRRPAADGESHDSLAEEADLIPTGIEHYQHSVLEALIRHYQDPLLKPLQCSLKDGIHTLETLTSAFVDRSKPHF